MVEAINEYQDDRKEEENKKRCMYKDERKDAQLKRCSDLRKLDEINEG